MALAAGTGGGGGGGYGGRSNSTRKKRPAPGGGGGGRSGYSGGTATYNPPSPPPVAPSSSGSYYSPRPVPTRRPGPVRSVGPPPPSERWGPRVSIGKHSYWKGSPAYKARVRSERRQDLRQEARQDRRQEMRQARQKRRQAKERRRDAVPSIKKYLAGDVTYQDVTSELQRALQQFLETNRGNTRDVRRDFSTALERLQQEKSKSLEQLEADFAARGLLKSGLYAEETGDYMEKFRSNVGDLRTDRSDQLSDLKDIRQNTRSQSRANRQKARREALRRRAERYSQKWINTGQR